MRYWSISVSRSSTVSQFRNLPRALLILLSLVIQGGLSDKASDLLSCYNFNTTDGPPATFEDFLKNQPARLQLHDVLWSKHKSSLPLTVVTALTPSRLGALTAQCKSWSGPLGAAVYVVLQQSTSSNQLTEGSKKELQHALGEVKEVFSRLEGSDGACQLRVMVLYEVVGDELLAAILPINSLRNAAMLLADTPLLAMVDVDLLVSASLAQEVQKTSGPTAIMPLAYKHKVVVVLPAFETHKSLDLEEGCKVAEAAVAGGKQQVTQTVKSGELHPFALYVYVRGHSATEYTKWYTSDAAYPIEYAVNYEPWFVIDRLACPFYDVRFRGYGWNKVQHVAFVNATGYDFVAHPTAFLVHRPHPKSDAQGLYSKAGSGGAGKGKGGTASPAKQFHRKVNALRHVVLRDMLRGLYEPVVDQGSSHCRATLEWWGNR